MGNFINMNIYNIYMVKIDELDKKIIESLKERRAVNPNTTFIAKRLGKPIATIHSRIKKLERQGVISKFIPVLRYEEKEKPVEAFILMQIHPGDDVNEIASQLTELDEIVELYMIVGEWCFIAKLRAKNMEEYTKMVRNIIKNVRLLKTLDIISPKVFKKEF